jgi:hypothetical protein
VRTPSRKPLIDAVTGTIVALLVLAASPTVSARGGYHHSQAVAPPPCGFVVGALADPADTQRCLAERYKPPKPKPSAAPAPSNAASSNAAPPAAHGE